jgi:hypothetical protein
MPIVTPRNKEIVVAKAALHSLAQGMTQLAAEASRIAIPGRQRIRQVVR